MLDDGEMVPSCNSLDSYNIAMVVSQLVSQSVVSSSSSHSVSVWRRKLVNAHSHLGALSLSVVVVVANGKSIESGLGKPKWMQKMWSI